MIETPTIVTTREQKVAKVHVKVPRSEIREVMGPGLTEVNAALEAQKIAPAGPWLTHHLRMDPEFFDFEICVPVTKTVKPTGRVVPGTLPARRVVRTVYHGEYEGLGAAWGELMDWIGKEGHAVADDLWEVYAEGPESGPDPSGWRTELNKPLAG